jgi:aspartokinase-like uncharacterized kinase
MGTPELKSWLDVIAKHGDGRVVIVPGGGIYADAVREAQRIAKFDDAAAHHLALLAMEQYGLTMEALQPELATASSELEISERSWQHRGILWLPCSMVLAEDDIPKSWDVTSDSLAAWLAHKINASRLLLVKHEAVSDDTPLAQLAKDGVVDPAFPTFAAGLEGRFRIVGKDDFADVERVLTSALQPPRAVH